MSLLFTKPDSVGLHTVYITGFQQDLQLKRGVMEKIKRRCICNERNAEKGEN